MRQFPNLSVKAAGSMGPKPEPVDGPTREVVEVSRHMDGGYAVRFSGGSEFYPEGVNPFLDNAVAAGRERFYAEIWPGDEARGRSTLVNIDTKTPVAVEAE